MLYRLNLDANWRNLTPQKTPDLNMKDVEILLRGFAMLINHDNYSPSLTKFLNNFSSNARKYTDEDIAYYESLFKVFAAAAVAIDTKIFFSKNGRFNIAIYESIFVALAEDAFKAKNTSIKTTDTTKIRNLKEDKDFIAASQSNTASTSNVILRINKAKELL